MDVAGEAFSNKNASVLLILQKSIQIYVIANNIRIFLVKSQRNRNNNVTSLKCIGHN